MTKKTIAVLVVLGLLLVAGLGVLIWWFVRPGPDNLYETIKLEGDGIGDVDYTAALTRIQGDGYVNSMFWWFYPTLASSPTTRPIILWLNGVTGTAPSFLANFVMFGPYDVNLNRRNDSWVNDYNLLFIDAPLGTGFSKSDIENDIEFHNLDQNVNHLLRTMQSFYDLHEDYKTTPLYICSQADGSQLAISLAIKMFEGENTSDNLKGVILGNPVISPALALTRLGFYLEELGYIDANGRTAIENFSNITSTLVENEEFENAFDQFSSLGNFVNENAGAIAVNLDRIVEKLTRNQSQDFFGETSYLRSVLQSDVDIKKFMNTVVAPALGIPEENQYDEQRETAIHAFKNSYMIPIVNKVEDLLKNTDLTVNIYNGNLDAVSNTPGQLDWINNLEWSGQSQFLNATRETLIVNSLVEGYFRESDRLSFYWINAAGQSVPLDNEVAVRRILNRIVNL